MADKLRADNPGFSHLLDLLHGGYLRGGVRSSVSGRLEQVGSKCTPLCLPHVHRLHDTSIHSIHFLRGYNIVVFMEVVL